jgi:zinc transport system substrate-binding protein
VSPDREAVFNRNLESLKRDLKELDSRMLAAARKLGNAPVIFSHPVYQYLQRRYRLNGESLHWEPNEEVSAEQWQTLVTLLDRHPARWMVWEDTPLAATSKRLMEMGIGVIVFSPAANATQTDFMSIMQKNVRAFERITEQ